MLGRKWCEMVEGGKSAAYRNVSADQSTKNSGLRFPRVSGTVRIPPRIPSFVCTVPMEPSPFTLNSRSHIWLRNWNKARPTPKK